MSGDALTPREAATRGTVAIRTTLGGVELATLASWAVDAVRVDSSAPGSRLGVYGYGSTGTRYAVRTVDLDGRRTWRRVWVTVYGNGGTLGVHMLGRSVSLELETEHALERVAELAEEQGAREASLFLPARDGLADPLVAHGTHRTSVELEGITAAGYPYGPREAATVASYWQSPAGPGATFAALASGRSVTRGQLLAAIGAEVSAARRQGAEVDAELEALRYWALLAEPAELFA